MLMNVHSCNFLSCINEQNNTFYTLSCQMLIYQTDAHMLSVIIKKRKILSLVGSFNLYYHSLQPSPDITGQYLKIENITFQTTILLLLYHMLMLYIHDHTMVDVNMNNIVQIQNSKLWFDISAVNSGAHAPIIICVMKLVYTWQFYIKVQGPAVQQLIKKLEHDIKNKLKTHLVNRI